MVLIIARPWNNISSVISFFNWAQLQTKFSHYAVGLAAIPVLSRNTGYITCPPALSLTVILIFNSNKNNLVQFREQTRGLLICVFQGWYRLLQTK